MAVKIQLRRGTSTQWADANPILSEGEQAYETDTRSIKIGDGVSAWNNLPYSNQKEIAKITGTTVKFDSPSGYGMDTPISGPVTFDVSGASFLCPAFIRCSDTATFPQIVQMEGKLQSGINNVYLQYISDTLVLGKVHAVERIVGTIMQDDFTGNEIDLDTWELTGASVITQQDGYLKIDTTSISTGNVSIESKIGIRAGAVEFKVRFISGSNGYFELNLRSESAKSVGIGRSGSPYNLNVLINGAVADTTAVAQPSGLTTSSPFMSFKIERAGNLFKLFYDPLGGSDYIAYGNVSGYTVEDFGEIAYLRFIAGGHSTNKRVFHFDDVKLTQS